MKHRIEKEKIMLINHVKQLNKETLARQVYNQQVENKWPGLAMETERICRRLNISNINTTPFEKDELKNLASEICVAPSIEFSSITKPLWLSWLGRCFSCKGRGFEPQSTNFFNCQISQFLGPARGGGSERTAAPPF